MCKVIISRAEAFFRGERAQAQAEELGDIDTQLFTESDDQPFVVIRRAHADTGRNFDLGCHVGHCKT